MNTSQINGAELNGSTYAGHNATLQGGFVSAAMLAGVLMTGVILVGGVSSNSISSGAISTQLQGGVTSTAAYPGGTLLITINLQQGMSSDQEVGSLNLGMEPSLRDGVYSPVTVGGQVKTHVKLQAEDQVGQSSFFDGKLLRSDGLSGGFEKTAYVGGGIRGSTVLASDGVKSTYQINSNVMTLGLTLHGGVASDSAYGGKYKYNAILSGGFLTTYDIGKELDIEAILVDGIYNVDSVGGGYRISPVGNGGLESSTLFSARQQLSPTAVGGLDVNQTFDAKLRVSPRMQGGIAKTAFIGGKGITASQLLRGGIAPVAGNSLGGQLKVNALLQGAVISSAVIHGEMVQGFLDPLLNTWALEIRSATVLLEIKHPTEDI